MQKNPRRRHGRHRWTLTEETREAPLNPEETQETPPDPVEGTQEAPSNLEETKDEAGPAVGSTGLGGPIVPARLKLTISGNLPPNIVIARVESTGARR